MQLPDCINELGGILLADAYRRCPMLRRILLGGAALLFVALFFVGLPSNVRGQGSACGQQTMKEGDWWRVHSTIPLYVSPGQPAEKDSLRQAQEVKILQGKPTCLNGVWWYPVHTLDKEGWMPQETDRSETAVKALTITMQQRYYSDGWVYASPSRVEFHAFSTPGQVVVFEGLENFDEKLFGTMFAGEIYQINRDTFYSVEKTSSSVKLGIKAEWFLKKDRLLRAEKWHNPDMWALFWKLPEGAEVPTQGPLTTTTPPALATDEVETP
jgi:hypothetical protein